MAKNKDKIENTGKEQKSGDGIFGGEKKTSPLEYADLVTDKLYGTAVSNVTSADPTMKEGIGRTKDMISSASSVVGLAGIRYTEKEVWSAMEEHWGSPEERERTNTILNESVGGKVNVEEHFENVAAANFLQEKNTTVSFRQHSLDVEMRFENDLRPDSDASVFFNSILKGEVSFGVERADGENDLKTFKTDNIRIFGSRGAEQDMSLRDYARSVQKAYRGKSQEEIRQIHERFAKNFDKLALVSEQIVNMPGSGEDSRKKIIEYYGANISVDMDDNDAIGLLKRRNVRINTDVGGGIDYDASVSSLISGDGSVVRGGSARRYALESNRIRNGGISMNDAAHEYIPAGKTRLNISRAMINKEISQYRDYLEYLELNEAGLRDIQKALRSGDYQSRSEIAANLEKILGKNYSEGLKGVNPEDIVHIVGELTEADAIKSRIDSAFFAHSFENKHSRRVKRIVTRQTNNDRDLAEGMDKLDKAVKYSVKAGQIGWHGTFRVAQGATYGLGTVEEALLGTDSLKRASEKINDARKAPSRLKKERRKRKERKLANKRARKDLKKKARKSAAGKVRGVIGRHLDSILSLFKGSFIKWIAGALAGIILIILLVIIVIISALMCTSSSYLENDAHFTKTAIAVLDNLEKKADNEKDAIWSQLQAQAQALRDEGAVGFVTEGNTGVNYYNMMGDQIIATIVDYDADGNRKYTRKNTFRWSDDAPQNYINAKQIMVASDFVLSEEYGKDFSTSEAVAFTSELYDATHSATYVVNTYTDESGTVHITGATVTCYVTVAASEGYEYVAPDPATGASGQERKEKIDLILGPIYEAQISARNTVLKDSNKSSFYYSNVLDVYENVISQNWEELYEVKGYDLYDNGGGDGAFEFVPDEILKIDSFWNAADPYQFYNGASMSATFVGDIASALPEGSYRYSSVYGKKRSIDGGKPHCGTDLAAAKGTPVFAAASGTVILAKDHYCTCERRGNGCPHNSSPGAGFGNCVYIKLDEPFNGSTIITVYGHMVYGSIQVTNGQHVDAGTVIGAVGASGKSTGYHLHFGAYRNSVVSSNVINPAPFLVATP